MILRQLIIAIKSGKISEIKKFISENEKYLSPSAMMFGFIVDSFTLTRADLWLDNLILISYLFLAGIIILILNTDDIEFFRKEKIQKIILFSPIALQFAYGGLFSGFVVLYSRSASLSSSWPFIAILAVLLVGNEFFQKRYKRLVFQSSIFFIALFSYLIFSIPVLINQIGPWVFVLSGVISLFSMFLLSQLIIKISPSNFIPYKKIITSNTLAIYLVFNIMYFSGIIPPIPLTMKRMVVAHSVIRTGNNFTISYEPPRWYHLFKSQNPVYSRFPNERVYVYSSIYAPTDINTTIIHEWSKYDEVRKKWVVRDRLAYQIFGGSQNGYRGYSFKTVIEPGTWRVAIKTKNGQTLGRTKFKVIQTSTPPYLITETR